MGLAICCEINDPEKLSGNENVSLTDSLDFWRIRAISRRVFDVSHKPTLTEKGASAGGEMAMKWRWDGDGGEEGKQFFSVS